MWDRSYGLYMARIARVVVEGMPTTSHSVATGDRRPFFWWRLCRLPILIWWRNGAGNMGLSPDPESYSSDCHAWKEGESQANHWGGSSPIYTSYQFQGRLAWTFVARAVFFFCDGWALSGGLHNPVRAKLVGQGWSSAAAHISRW